MGYVLPVTWFHLVSYGVDTWIASRSIDVVAQLIYVAPNRPAIGKNRAASDLIRRTVIWGSQVWVRRENRRVVDIDQAVAPRDDHRP
jgi:hypothetical protein